MESNPHIIRLQQADIVQQNGALILEHIDLTIGQGEFVYLVGKTGSGKTSLLKTLYGELPLHTGFGEVADFDLKILNRDSKPYLRRKLGIIFQDFALLTDRTIEDNLRFVLRATDWNRKSEIDERIDEVLTAVGLPDKREAMPYELSGGEQQRIVIARALLNNPVLLIADEPTGNLDPETSDDILVLIRNVARERNTAVLCATHDYRMLQNFPARVLRIQNKNLTE